MIRGGAWGRRGPGGCTGGKVHGGGGGGRVLRARASPGRRGWGCGSDHPVYRGREVIRGVVQPVRHEGWGH